MLNQSLTSDLFYTAAESLSSIEACETDHELYVTVIEYTSIHIVIATL